jgi:hypothetical protein
LDNPDPQTGHGSGASKTWAVGRMVLGLAQMMGAVIAAYLLLQTGMNEWSLTAVVLTCGLTAISVRLFGRRGDEGERD